METTEPRRQVSLGKFPVPFYAPPTFKKTSAEIISEARAAIMEGSRVATIRPVDTKRPFTPREHQRTLFGSKHGNSSKCRPPSSFSLAYLQFHPELDTGNTTPPHMRRLSPLTSSPSISLDSSLNSSLNSSSSSGSLQKASTPPELLELSVAKLKLPSISCRRQQFRAAASLDNLPEEFEEEECDSYSYQQESTIPPFRKSYSSPTQRTRPAVESYTSIHMRPHLDKEIATKKSKADIWTRSTEIDEENNFTIQGGIGSQITDSDIIKQVEKKETYETTSSDIFGQCVSSSEVTLQTPLQSPDTEYIENFKASTAKSSYNLMNSTIRSNAWMTERTDHFKVAQPWLADNNIPRSKIKEKIGTIKLTSTVDEPILRPIQEILQVTSTPIKDDIHSILEQLYFQSKKDGNDIEVILSLSKLYKRVDEQNKSGSEPPPTKLKSQILKTLYKFVDRSNETLLLQIARIMLLIRVSGSSLAGVCKLIFKVSRCDRNDKLFMEGDILEKFVEALGRATPLEDAESLVYGYGALKFLTMNTDLLERVLDLGALPLMVLHMKMVNTAKLENNRMAEQTSHALFQLTGALRNVAGEEQMFPRLIDSGAVTELCKAMDLFATDLDIISNVARTLSIISTHDECCNAIADYEPCFQVFVKLFRKYPGRQDIIVRLGYALGNLMAKSDYSRSRFYQEPEALECLLELLTIYLNKNLHAEKSEMTISNSEAGSNGSVQDVLVKVIRIIANMNINLEVGTSFACALSIFPSEGSGDAKAEGPYKNANRFLDILMTLLSKGLSTLNEELAHSVLSTLNNLTYYPTSKSGVVGERQLEIAHGLLQFLQYENRECLIETLRVYGNLTRSQEIRNFLIEKEGLSQLLRLLEVDDRELLCCTVGILINMMADWNKRIAFKEAGGVSKLIHVLAQHGEADWQLSTLICQALWNYCIEATDLQEALGFQETNQLLSVLADYLDEERLFGITEGAEVSDVVVMSHCYQVWEEFAGVATNLVEKIDNYLTSIEPLEVLPAEETEDTNLEMWHV